MKVATQRKILARCCTSAVLISTALFAAESAHARGLEDIRVSRVGARTTIEIELGCAMRYINHGSTLAGAEVRIQMVTAQDCVTTLRGTSNELRRPVAGRLASLREIEFDRDAGDFQTVDFTGGDGYRIDEDRAFSGRNRFAAGANYAQTGRADPQPI